MKEPQQPQRNIKETEQGQLATHAILIEPRAPNKHATNTTPPQPLLTTIDPGLSITSPYASDVRKLKILTLLIVPANRTHLGTSRFSLRCTSKTLRPDELQRIRKASSSALSAPTPLDGGAGEKQREQRTPTNTTRGGVPGGD